MLSGLEGGRERGGLIWGVLSVGVIFCFGVVCLGFFKSVSQYRQQPRLTHVSDGTEIQCPIVTTLVDSTFMWPLILLLRGLLRIDFLQFLFFFKSELIWSTTKTDHFRDWICQCRFSTSLLKRTVPSGRNHTRCVALSSCFFHLQPQFVNVVPKTYHKYCVSLTSI